MNGKACEKHSPTSLLKLPRTLRNGRSWEIHCRFEQALNLI